jgi:gliding motility-associated-like protein
MYIEISPMIRNYSLFLFFCISVFTLSAQKPVSIQKANSENLQGSRGCSDQYAGTVTRSNYTGSSNDRMGETIYMCYNDRITFTGNNDADLTGDPLPATTPGIGYAFYSCRPTIAGPTLNDILTDPCIFQGPPAPALGLYIDNNGNANGTQTFINAGFLQNTFNGGNPIQLWFSLITVDDFANAAYEGTPSGMCTNANIATAFSVVYLNQISISSLSVPAPNALNGSFVVSGGLPQFDQAGPGRFYSFIEIELISNPAIKGTITNPASITHGATVQFTVPQAGNYRVRVRDGKSCPGEFSFSMPRNQVEFQMPTVNVTPGEFFCIPVTVSNLVDALSVQFSVNWDPTIIRFNAPNIPNPSPLAGMDLNNFQLGNAPNGELFFIWLDDELDPATLPDNTVLFELCFTAIGFPGNMSDLLFTDRPGFIEVVNSNGVSTFTTINGKVNIVNPVILTTYGRSCSTTTNSGSITFSAAGGRGPYSYELTNGSGVIASGVFNTANDLIILSNLMPDTYAVQVTDADGNISILNITVAMAASIFVNVAPTNPRCVGDRNGRVLASVGGGTQPYVYKWSTGQFGVNEITTLPAGFYGVTVIDNNGCSAEASTTLGVIGITSNISGIPPSCPGVNDGSATVAPTGGNGPYNYLWSGGGSLATKLNLGEGKVKVTITDANLCSHQDSITLVASKVITLTTTSFDTPSCRGDSDGSICINITESGGSPPNVPYNFTWSGGTVVNTSPSSCINNLPAGVYGVTISDGDGCQIDSIFELLNPASLTLFVFQLDSVSCNGPGDDGAITIIAGGGTMPYNFNWNNGAYTGNQLQNLPAGMYDLVLTDANGCSITASYEIPTKGTSISFTTTPVTCQGGSDGTATVIVGDPTATILWASGSSSNTITNLMAGYHVLTVTDASGCARVDSVFVDEPLPLIVDILNTSPACPGGNDGTIEIMVSGGLGPYSYQWGHTTAVTPILNNQRAGTYNLTVTDASTCGPQTFAIELINPPFIMFSFGIPEPVSCDASDCDGSITLTLSGGAVFGGAFDVVWSSGQSNQDVMASTAVNLCAGQVTATVTDENGCIQTESANIPVPDMMRINEGASKITDVSCFGLSDGSINIEVEGGSGPYNYVWPDLMTSGQILSNLSAGSYLLNVLDTRGCIFDTLLVINEPALLELNIDSLATSNLGCSGTTDGQITVVPVGGNVGTLEYRWTPDVSTSNVASGLAAGTYVVTVVDIKGCSASASYTVTEPVPIVATIPVPVEPVCFGQTTSVTVTTASGGSGPPYSFNVDNGPLSPLGINTPILAGEHLIRVFDSKGCTYDETIIVNQPPAVLVDLEDEITIDLGDSIALIPIIQSIVGIDEYMWNNGTTLTCDDCPEPTAFPQGSTTYTLTVIDQNGCMGSDNITIKVSKRRYVFIPDAFSPNLDGVNDVFTVFTGKGVVSINNMRVFNRWGDMMYENANIEPSSLGSVGWDGRFNGKMMDTGVYVYAVEITFLDGTTLLYKGDVTLIQK